MVFVALLIFAANQGSSVRGQTYDEGQLALVKQRFAYSEFGYAEWNSWREQDGMLCRDELDCEWIDTSMYCKGYYLDKSEAGINRDWFGGQSSRVYGKCVCQGWTDWDIGTFDHKNFKCAHSTSNMLWTSLFVVLGIVGLGCCAVGLYCFIKKRDQRVI